MQASAAKGYKSKSGIDAIVQSATGCVGACCGTPSYFQHARRAEPTTWYSAVPNRSHLDQIATYAAMFASDERLFTGRAAGDRRRSPRGCSFTASTCTRRMCGGAFSSRVRPSAQRCACALARRLACACALRAVCTKWDKSLGTHSAAPTARPADFDSAANCKAKHALLQPIPILGLRCLAPRRSLSHKSISR